MEYKIGLIGCGTVGQGLLEILQSKKAHLKDAHDFEAKVVAINDKIKGSLLVPEGLDLGRVLKVLEAGKNLDAYLEGRPNPAQKMEPLEMIEQSGADIIAEMTYTDIKTGEPATSFIKKALRLGKHVVTSNKGPAALHYAELKKLADSNRLFFGIEGTVMSGTPVFNLCRAGFAGNDIKEIRGILNGTTNFILSKMEEEGMEYQEALALAQKLGYAEADPTADVEGFDALAKVVILANVLMGGSLRTSDVKPEGITKISRPDVLKAKGEGYRYKLIGRVKKDTGGVTASVSPQKLPLTDPLTGVMGAQNALTFDLDLLGQVTIQGPGAGKIATGYSILIDMLAVHGRKAV
ncbi:MAG: homoserine dehydrogenase [Candidatus Aminicenantes bacterium RBG_13_63_10]|nr:MAG: homoserine dehydrogenase [Candidatus Aminicenantes bacterium RBG_13_63_10]